MNCMKEIAELLGVGMYKEFYVSINGEPYPYTKYKISKKGLLEYYEDIWVRNDYVLHKFVNGEAEIMNLPLTPKERKYLKEIIEPFENKVISIVKVRDNNGECIKIRVKDNLYASVILPHFETGTRFKGMQPNYEYSMEKINL